MYQTGCAADKGISKGAPQDGRVGRRALFDAGYHLLFLNKPFLCLLKIVGEAKDEGSPCKGPFQPDAWNKPKSHHDYPGETLAGLQQVFL